MTTAASARGFGFRDVAATDAYAIPIGKALTIAKAIAAGKSSAAIHVGPTAFLGIQVQSDGDGGVLVAVALVQVDRVVDDHAAGPSAGTSLPSRT